MKTATNIQKLKKLALALTLAVLCVFNANSQTAWPKSKIYYTAPAGYGPGTAFFTKVIQPAMASISLQYNVCFAARTTQTDYINMNIVFIDMKVTYPIPYTVPYAAAINSGYFGKKGGKQDIQIPILGFNLVSPYMYSVALSSTLNNPAAAIADLKTILLRNAGITATNAFILYPYSCKYYSEGYKKTDLNEDGESVGAKEAIEFNVYPNPTSGSITIKSILTAAPENTKFYVRNTLGQVVLQGNLEVDSNLEVNTQIDMFNLDNGLYFFEVNINEERIIEKIIKQ